MLIHFPGSLRARRFEKSTDVGQWFGMDPGPPSGVGPGGVGKDTVHKMLRQ